MDNIQIQDESGDKKYFTIIPNYILNHSTLWDREVYIQMKRITGENGTCWTSRNTLAKQCGMSLDRLKKSIKYLIEHGWIDKIGVRKVDTSGGVQEVNEYRVIDLWNKNNSFYQKKYEGVSKRIPPNVKGGSSEIPPIIKGGSSDYQRGVVEDIKGGSSESHKEEPLLNKNHIKEDTTTALKQKFFLNPLMEEIQKQYPNRNYEFQFNLMCDWWLANKKKLPQHISALSNWLKNTKEEIIIKNKYANVKINTIEVSERKN